MQFIETLVYVTFTFSSGYLRSLLQKSASVTCPLLRDLKKPVLFHWIYSLPLKLLDFIKLNAFSLLLMLYSTLFLAQNMSETINLCISVYRICHNISNQSQKTQHDVL